MKTNTNQQLFDVYSSKWATLCKSVEPLFNDETLNSSPTTPLFLKIDESTYHKSDLKVMFFGQETNRWYKNDVFRNDKIEIVDQFMSKYYDFFYNGRCWKKGGYFWNGIKRFQSMLNGKFSGRTIHYTWNNIIKIGKSEGKGRPPLYIYNIERDNFNVICEELKILKPDILIFFTGPNYDDVIRNNFGDVVFSAIEPFPKRQLAQLILTDYHFAARTYHPNFLWRNGFEEYISAMIQRI